MEPQHGHIIISLHIDIHIRCHCILFCIKWTCAWTSCIAFCVPQPCHCDIWSCCTQGMCRCRSFGEHTSHARSQTQAHNSLWCRLLHLPPLYANYPCGETDFSENLWRRWGTSGRPSRPHLWQQLHQVLHRQPQLPKAGVEINFLKVEYDSSSTVFRNLWCLAQIPRFWIQIWASAERWNLAFSTTKIFHEILTIQWDWCQNYKFYLSTDACLD